MNITFSSGNQLISRTYRTVTKKIVLKLYTMGGAGLGWALLEEVIKSCHQPLIQGSGNMAEEGGRKNLRGGWWWELWMLTSGLGAAASIKAQQLRLPAQDPHKIKPARIPIRGGTPMALS